MCKIIESIEHMGEHCECNNSTKFWTPVSTKLPENEDNYFVRTIYGNYGKMEESFSVCHYYPDRNRWECTENDIVTHWAKIPAN